MGKSLDDIRAIKEELKDNLFWKSPYNQVVNGVGISTLRARSALEKVVLKEGEDLDDYCISVHLKEKPSAHLNFPNEYKGVRICYDVVGEIKLR